MQTKQLFIESMGMEREATLGWPLVRKGLIVFCYGSQRNRMNPIINNLSNTLNERGFATLSYDLLSQEEEIDIEKKYDINIFSERLSVISNWIRNSFQLPVLYINLFNTGERVDMMLRTRSLLAATLQAASTNHNTWQEQGYDKTANLNRLIIVGSRMRNSMNWDQDHINELADKYNVKIMEVSHDSSRSQEIINNIEAYAQDHFFLNKVLTEK